MGADPDPHLIAQVNWELQENDPQEDDIVRQERDEDYRQGSMLRDNMDGQMSADYQVGCWDPPKEKRKKNLIAIWI